jgi:Na+/H+-dicarboxylate symporter
LLDVLAALTGADDDPNVGIIMGELSFDSPSHCPFRHFRPGGPVSLTARVAGGLALGLAAGAVAYATRNSALLALAALAGPVGTLWVNAILMTVVPLVVSSLVVGVASAGDPRLVGRLGRWALALFLLLVSCSAILTALIAPPLLARLPNAAAAAASLRPGAPSAGASPGSVPTAVQWLIGIVPSNPVRAAADGAMLPLVVFTLVFALALTRIEPALRQAVLRFFEGVAAAMRVLVGWVLALAPLGVFALSLPLAARLGAAAAGALAYFVVLVSAISVILLLALYPVAVVGGRLPLRRFARAAAPAQAVAFSSGSSLASLPALIEGAERWLGLPPAVTGFCLPLAVSMFKLCGPVVMVVGVLFIGRLYGVAIVPTRLAQVAAGAVLLSFATPGVPGGGLLVAAPLFVAAGLPVEAIGILLAVDTIPDRFRAPANVTADLTVAAIVGRYVLAPPASPALEPLASAAPGSIGIP